MRHLKIHMVMAAALVLAVLMGLAGCGDDHRDRFRDDRDRHDVRYEQRDGDRHDERQDSDRHDDHGGESGHEAEHGDR